jgi:transposase
MSRWCGDASEGRALLKQIGPCTSSLHLLMDRAYEGNEAQQLALDLGHLVVVPPLSRRRAPWEFDRLMYKRRNEAERLFRCLKGFRRVFCRYDKLGSIYIAFIYFALIVDELKNRA